MKRRDWLRGAVTGTALAAAAQAPQPAVAQTPPPSNQDTPKLTLTAADAAADGATHFFTATELQTLEALAKAIFPAANGRAGALEAGVPAFLDFLISQSPADRQSLYRQGLAALAAESFASADAVKIDRLLAPLRQSWTYAEPADPLARFLRAAKDDILLATTNSREWAASNRSRTGSGSNYYYFTIE